jgi:hypothetical protein
VYFKVPFLLLIYFNLTIEDNLEVSWSHCTLKTRKPAIVNLCVCVVRACMSVYLYVCIMCVCVCVCMHICMYCVCVYVCMYVCVFYVYIYVSYMYPLLLHRDGDKDSLTKLHVYATSMQLMDNV